MPELPDIVVYLEALEPRILGQTLERLTITAPFLLRTAAPPIESVTGGKVVDLRRLGKRIVIGFDNDLWLVFHLMIAGRLHWKAQAQADDGVGKNRSPRRAAASLPAKNRLAAFEFGVGTLTLTEAGAKRRASLHLIEGETNLQRLDPGGLEVFEIDLETFAAALQSENHTLKRALADPRLLSGIGNAYSDEILWDAHLSPIALTQKLTREEIERLFNSTLETLTRWTNLLREDAAGNFPEKVTAFRPEMAVHGKYEQPCPRCGSRVQRIRYASNETNYCPGCQTGGKLLADRALSRLLRSDWPRTAEDLEGLSRR
ncbi:MAG TPA: DNA-formamidopyrimidine glycosylase family protein [Pyrinomonadaceae bacterium]|nr:DNA-formamidopyrimidine glycosylase family protein [Pyrinomonadaceae bacterium]